MSDLLAWVKSISEKVSERKFLHWSTLHAIGSSPILSIAIYGAILVPFLSAEVRILKELRVFSSNPFGNVGLPLTMLFSYLFSLIFALASIVASLCCPATIKLHGNIVNFLADISDVSKQINPHKAPNSPRSLLGGQNKDKITDNEIDAIFRAMAEHIGQQDFESTVAKFTDQSIDEWGRMEKKSPRLRCSIGVAYVVSFIIGIFTFFFLMPVSIFI
ncbi:hypothetical protein ACFMBG_14860 [Leisingera sp. D0M16]|uniref:hypothetical protein n=1 Tax=Leisingera coralii TaxID=3351347 RepID=UPI003B7AA960